MVSSPDLSSFSTKAARAEEQRRRKMRRELLLAWQRSRQTLDADSEAAIRDISDEEWQAALESEDEAL